MREIEREGGFKDEIQRGREVGEEGRESERGEG